MTTRKHVVVQPIDRHWKETQAQGTYIRSKQRYEQAAIALADALLERGKGLADLREEFRKAKRQGPEKHVYRSSAIAFAEALLEHEWSAELAPQQASEFQAAKLVKADAWRVLCEVMFK